jgi:hypothetical protein
LSGYFSTMDVNWSIMVMGAMLEKPFSVTFGSK